MRNFILSLVAVAALATTAQAGWTVVYDFHTRKPVVIYTPDRPPTYRPSPYVQPYNPYVYPAPCPHTYRPPCPPNHYDRRPYDRHRHR